MRNPTRNVPFLIFITNCSNCSNCSKS